MTNINIDHLPGGVTAVPGFLASGIAAGLKKSKPDIAVIYSPTLCSAAGVFTTNVVKAAPVLLNMKLLPQGYGFAHGIVVNSGNANACNGAQGLTDAQTMGAAAAKALGIEPQYMLVCSTGVIGVPLPMEKVLPGIERAVQQLSSGGGHDAAIAIKTTDLVTKEKAVQLEINGCNVTIGAMAKGSGMIHPNMATMLAFITTDAVIEPEVLHCALKEAVDSTFNMITIDGDTSTNDSVLILANGLADMPTIKAGSAEYALFVAALTEVCKSLAQSIARDGEGATTLLEVTVKNAATIQDARLAARAVAGSNLLKSAVFGRDANWGRIICAVGYSGAKFNPEKVDIYLGDILVAQNGGAVDFSEEAATAVLAEDKVTVTVDLHAGNHRATAWGCDLTYEYVRINASYRT